MDKDKLKLLPDLPGIYLMKDTHGAIFYVGKAKNLKNRVRSYFQHNNQRSKKVQRMIWNIADVTWQVVDTELDALLLECQLIQSHHPLYNRMMTKHRQYPWVILEKNGLQLSYNPELLSGKPVFGPFRQKKQLELILTGLNDTYLLAGTNPLTALAVKKQLPEMTTHPIIERQSQAVGYFQGENDFLLQLTNRITAAATALNFENAANLQQLLEGSRYFFDYLSKQRAFVQKKRQLLVIPLADGRKKCYFVSCGQLIATKIIPATKPATFDLNPLTTPPAMTQAMVDPLDILQSYFTYHPDLVVDLEQSI